MCSTQSLLLRGLAVWVALSLAGCGWGGSEPGAGLVAQVAPGPSGPPTEAGSLAVATFAGGCFWCMEPPFEELEGVHEVISGYTGGETAKPSYEEVSAGRTGHAEAVEVHYDPARIGYERLLEVFWRQIDPTDPGGQFADRGLQYRTAIFYRDEEERRLAEESKAELERSGRFDRPVVTEIVPAGPFYPAEEYHQDYYRKSPVRYKRYRQGSGREGFLARTWNKPGRDAGLKNR